ncbi:MAG: adenylate/guanylate cyclase domain-containing protein, partial [Pseudomonadota bacterium]
GAWFYWFWRSPVASAVLYTALVIHIALAFWSIYRRRTFQLKAIDWLQLLLGLSIPLFLASHIAHTRAAYELFGQIDTYTLKLTIFYVLVPHLIYQQMALLVLVWGHGIIGVHQWLKLKSGYKRLQGVVFFVAILLPCAALSGVWATGRDIARLASDPDWLNRMLARSNRIDLEELQTIARIENAILAVLAALLCLALVGRFVRDNLGHRNGRVRISYPERTVTVSKGTSVLEASIQHRIPHASVCGGRGRCSTCRVTVQEGLQDLPSAKAEEAGVLQRINAQDNVRLACQIRPMRDMTVVPLLSPTTTARPVVGAETYVHGQEREIVVLFADLRDFTAISEQKLPYDVVFLLNRYFAVMGGAISKAGGHVDKFIGDGIMALFGLEGGIEDASRAALRAARNMAEELDRLNQDLADDLPAPLRMGIGLCNGPAIVGQMGYGEASSLTAIGDTVNTASRLETACKAHGVQLVLSEEIARLANIQSDHFKTEEIEVRGRKQPIRVTLVTDASVLALDVPG